MAQGWAVDTPLTTSTKFREWDHIKVFVMKLCDIKVLFPLKNVVFVLENPSKQCILSKTLIEYYVYCSC